MSRLHFLGINGSGMVGVACLAKKMGYDVDGCDSNLISNYTKQLNDLNIDIKQDQSKEHINGIDKLIISAAILYKDKYKNIEEVVSAMDSGIEVIKWQEFVDKYLAKDKELICVAGTHGKTTTTSFISNLLEDLNQDPSSLIGGINSRWNTTYRFGNGPYFVCESDEYGNNFLAYHPKYIILNNIEMEHPEFFENEEIYNLNFINFIRNIKDNGLIIFNADDNNILKIIDSEREYLNNKNVRLVSYSKDNNLIYKNYLFRFYKGFIDINGENYKIENIIGDHNFRNITISIVLMKELGFSYESIYKSILNLSLPKRRLEKIFDNGHIRLYDDYAHHHVQVQKNLNALVNNLSEDEKIIAILEPHLISRFIQNYREYIDYMSIADYPVITTFFKSRESDLSIPDMSFYLSNTKIKFIDSFDLVVKYINEILKIESKVTIIVMGAGNSYKLSDKILNIL